jgi:serine/threonine protein kinase/tetratricopeptide (TPR) repeat protein
MDHVGPFQLVRRLGRGGMGQVWLARHERMPLPVALKALDTSRLDAAAAERLLAAEVRAMARLDHPHIGRVFDHGVAGDSDALPPGTPWFAMEHCSSDLQRQGLRLRWPRLRPLVHQLLDALGHAHARGVVHRDLKRSNVLISTAGDARPGLKLVDFGIAAMGSDALRSAGSPSTMAPEQHRRDLSLVGPWTDLYALGSLVWRLVTGSRPTGDARGDALIAAKQQADFVPFDARFAVPDHLEDWLRQLMQPEPADRPPSAAAALAALEQRRTVAPKSWRDPAHRQVPRMMQAAGHTLWAWRQPVFTGRHDARDTLWRLLWRVAHERRGEGLCLTGPPGVGATALGRWWLERVHARTHAYVGQVAGRPAHDADAGVQRLVDDLLQPFGTPRDPVGRRQGLVRLGLQHLQERLDPLVDAPALSTAVEATAELVEGIAEQLPVALFLDDLGHDPGLGLLASRLASSTRPIAVVCRDAEAPPGMQALPLSALRTPELSEVLSRLLPLMPAVHGEVVADAHGFPGALRARLRALVPGLVLSDDGFDHPRPLPRSEPDAAWLEGLADEHLLLLEQAAWLGADVAVAMWAAAAQCDTAVCQRVLLDLERRGWLGAHATRLTLSPTVVAALRDRARAAGRQVDQAVQAASALAAYRGDPLAEGRCWEAAGLYEEAARAWVVGWRRLVQRHGPKVALGAIVDAERLLADVPPTPELHGERLRVELELRFFLRQPDVQQRAEAALALATDLDWPDLAATSLRAVAFALHDDPPAVVEVYEALHAQWFERCSPHYQADLLVSWYFHAERFAEPNRDALYDDVMQRLEGLADPHMRRLRYAVRTLRLLRDRSPQAVDVAREAVRLSQQHSPLQLCQDWSQLGWALQQQGDAQGAERAFREAAAAATWLDQPNAHTWALANLAGLSALGGRWDEAAHRAQQALAGSQLTYINAVMKLLCTPSLAEQGQWAEVRALWPEIAEVVPQVVPADPEVLAAARALLERAELEGHPHGDAVRSMIARLGELGNPSKRP